MCECCAHNADSNQAHVHVGGINCTGCLGKLKDVLADVPGVANVEFIQDKKQAKVIFDKRIIELESLSKTLNEKGYTIS